MFLGYNFSTMKKYWPLLAIVVLLIAIIGMSQYADSAKQRYEESTRQAKATPVAKCDDRYATNNAENTYKPPVWGKFVTWPEGVGAWAIILTLLAIAWQSAETREAAKATRDSVELQKGQLRQWVEIGKTRSDGAGLTEGLKEFNGNALISLRYEIVNPTPNLMTISKIVWKVSRHRTKRLPNWHCFEAPDRNFKLPPTREGQEGYAFSISYFLDTAEDVKSYSTGRFGLEIFGIVDFIDVLGATQQQNFTHWAVCEPGKLTQTGLDGNEAFPIDC
jgi:hypothetical protein